MDVKTCEEYVLNELRSEQAANETLHEQICELAAENAALERQIAELGSGARRFLVEQGAHAIMRCSYASITDVNDFDDFDEWFSEAFRGVSTTGVDRIALKELVRPAFLQEYKERGGK